MTPTQLTIRKLRQDGYTFVQVVEHYNSFAKVRHDLFGVIDVLAMKPHAPLLAVQCTSKSNISTRYTKCLQTGACWVTTGNRFEVWGWWQDLKSKRWQIERRVVLPDPQEPLVLAMTEKMGDDGM